MPEITTTTTDAPPETCRHYGCEETDNLVHIGWRLQPFCPTHRETCRDCASVIHSEMAISLYDGGFACEDCAYSCEGCGDYYLSHHLTYGRCEDCYEEPEYTGQGIDHYGHTRPTVWLGGPLPRNEKGNHDGYYLGVELEVYADRSNANEGALALRKWGNDNLGNPLAIMCKEDSSVRGYEIVTQPMTPDFFESQDWESFFDLLNEQHPLGGLRDEPTEHGLHVHIGRVAFERDDVATAAFCYLIGQGNHLERIARREPYHYCTKVEKPASVAIGQAKPYGRQGMRLRNGGAHAGRHAINLLNEATIEIRAFRSTRSANQFRDAVRVVYLAADYVRSLRVNRQSIPPKALHWSSFAEWVRVNHPHAHASIAGIDTSTDQDGNVVVTSNRRAA